MAKPTYSELREALRVAITVIELLRADAIAAKAVEEGLARAKAAYNAAGLPRGRRRPQAAHTSGVAEPG